MLQIERSLAQAIVDRTMDIIDCNVNVMDGNGVIVASGDRSRVGQIHQGALLVLSKQGPVEIDVDLASKLDGARSGMNLPLRSEGRIVGCVGLTGNPKEIRQHAELVRMAAETMMEQAHLLGLLAHDARLREELVLSLIRDAAPTAALADWAKRFGIDIALPRVAAVVEVDSGTMGVDEVLVELQRLHYLLSTPARENLIATVSLNELVVLKPALNGKGQWDLASQRQRAESLLARLREGSALDVRLAVGQYFPNEGGLVRSYQIARTTLAIGKTLHPGSRAHFYADMVLPVLLDGLRQGWQAEELMAPLAPLMRHNRQGQLVRTLYTWFDRGMQMAATAKALNIHRNTLDYRMQRIQEISGLDLANTEDCVRLYLGLQMIPMPGQTFSQVKRPSVTGCAG